MPTFDRSPAPLRVALALLALLPAACGAGTSPAPGVAPAGSDGPYTYGPGSPDGIGKFYMGREIAFVMGHPGAGWLERDTRVGEERTDLLLANLPLEPDDVVADVGAGTGYFSLPIAALVPQGRVLAVDIQPEMLEIVRRRVAAGKLANVQTVLATGRDPRLPEAAVDLALFVDAYHEFEWPREVMQAVARSLTPGGRVVLVEYRAEDPRVPIKELHRMSERQARAEMAAVGLEWVETRDVLPWQHFMVFQRPAGAGADH
jgi:ubiquinone/menaquinone biosynthesis C-methylase UbiE